MPSIEETRAGDAFVESVAPRADFYRGPYPMWHGWALMDAFLAGIQWERQRAAQDQPAKGSENRR